MDRSRLFMVQVVCRAGMGLRHVVVGLDQGAPRRFDCVEALARYLFEAGLPAEPTADAPACQALSSREFEVALMFAAGSNHKRVALQLGLAPATVRNHLSACYRKLGVDNRSGLLGALAAPHERRPALVHLHHGAAAAGPTD